MSRGWNPLRKEPTEASATHRVDQIKAQIDLVVKYAKVFSGPDGEAVLADLKKTHFFERSEFHPDPREHARQSGERNVILRINDILKTNVQTLEKELERMEKHVSKV